MKQFKLLVFGLLLSSLASGQTVKIQTGTTVSKLDWEIGNMNFSPYNETLIGYSVFAGIEYLENKFFNLSSNLGVVRKGGKEKVTYVTETGELIDKKTEKATLDYITVNSTFDIQYPIKDKVLPFMSVGPRFDYLISYSNVFDSLKEIDALKKYNIGLILGGGIKYDLSKVQIGLRADYYLDFYKVADWPAQTGNLGGKVNDKTVTLNFMIGYKL